MLPSVLFWTLKSLYLTYFHAKNYNIILYGDDGKISWIENIAVATTNKHKKSIRDEFKQFVKVSVFSQWKDIEQ